MLENAAESHQSAARFVGQPLWTQDSRFENQNRRQDDKILHVTLILTRAKKNTTYQNADQAKPTPIKRNTDFWKPDLTENGLCDLKQT